MAYWHTVYGCTNNRYRTIRNQVQSPLLRLPAELRNHIFDYVFENITVDFDHQETMHGDYVFTAFSRDTYQDRRSKWTLPEIVRTTTVCRQIRAETALLPFTRSVFDLTSYTARGIQGALLSKILPMQRDAITRLRLEHTLKIHTDVDVWSGLVDIGIVKLPSLRQVMVELSTWGLCSKHDIEEAQSMIRGSFKDAKGSDPEVVFKVWWN